MFCHRQYLLSSSSSSSYLPYAQGRVLPLPEWEHRLMSWSRRRNGRFSTSLLSPERADQRGSSLHGSSWRSALLSPRHGSSRRSADVFGSSFLDDLDLRQSSCTRREADRGGMCGYRGGWMGVGDKVGWGVDRGGGYRGMDVGGKEWG